MGPDSDALELGEPEWLGGELAHLAEVARDIHDRGVPSNTRRSYGGDWRRFCSWCARHHRTSLPADPHTVAAYVLHMLDPERPRATKTCSGRVSFATAQRALSAIGHFHEEANHPRPGASPQLKRLMAKAARAHGRRPGRAPPLLVEHIDAIIEQMLLPSKLPSSLIIRDRALLLVGFGAALRRSELSGLDRRDVEFRARGAVIYLSRSKTNQTGELEFVPLEPANVPKRCPVRALRKWMAIAPGEERDPVFRKSFRNLVGTERMPDRQVDLAVKRWTKFAEISAEGGAVFSAHSLRAGFITEAARAGRPEWRIQQHSRHKTTAVLRDYIRLADPFSDHPARGLL